MQPKDFADQFGVSREILEKLEIYHRLLFKWQKAINLVGPKTLQDSWERHFADSAQLNQYIGTDVKTLADLGSGAGFPGLVLAIMRPEISVHLVESDERKAQFLRTVSRETSVDITVHNERIESVDLGVIPDMVSARALADLSLLFEYCVPWAQQNPALRLLFLKGREAQQEVDNAKQAFTFDYEGFPSVTSDEARLLLVTSLMRA